jgi:hypothetical protein
MKVLVSVSDAVEDPLIREWALASWLTVKVTDPPRAPAVADAATELSLEVAERAPHVVDLCIFCAAVRSAWNLVLSDWYDVTALWVFVRVVFRAVWGCASSCMSWLMIVLVSSPLTRPLTLVVDVAIRSSSLTCSGSASREMPCHYMELLIPGR